MSDSSSFWQKNGKGIAGASIIVLLVIFFAYVVVWRWMFSRVYVEPGEVLILKANVGEANPDPANLQVVKEGYKGVQEGVLGEGRHFFNPFTYKRITKQSLIEVKPDEVGVLVSKSGKPLPEGEFLAAPGFKGIRFMPLTPGKWRLNPWAFDVKLLKATQISPGFVGCVTALSNRSLKGKKSAVGRRGILPNVLQPGLYYINPRAFKVDAVEVGYRLITLNDVQFKSVDGFVINVDITAVWGVQPKNVPSIIDNLGNINDVVSKIITPQVNSIVRIEGSKHPAREFIEGKTREKFQNAFTAELKRICKEKKIDILIGLVRNIEIPHSVRDPINQAKIAVEERLMKREMQETQKIENTLENVRADVEKGIRETDAVTQKLVAQIRANGEREVLKIKGEREVDVAKIMKQVATIEAQIELVRGKAAAQVIAMLKTARADRFNQFVKALGSAKAYAAMIFTQGLSKDLKIMMRYSGKGTFWTDLPKTGDLSKKAATLKILND